MVSNTNLFNKIPTLSKLQQRIEFIMKYVNYCYILMLDENRKYKKSDSLKSDGKFHLEVFLNKKLVDDYLTKHKEYYINYIANEPNLNVYFNNETSQLLKDGTDEFIDIQINETKLDEYLSGATLDQVYFAIECKLINTGYSDYVSDITKFCNYEHETFRLPFEGQIGYVLNPNYTPENTRKGINKSLENNSDIKTIKFLKSFSNENSCESCFYSEHIRNYDNTEFSIYHLILGYDKIVI